MSSNPFLRKVDQAIVKRSNKYEIFGFKQNPFPRKPGVIIGSDDYRENGSIYLPNLRKNEEKKFEELLIPNTSRPEVKTIAFLMDYATKKGRGIGKTAFLNYQKKRIMEDLGAELSENTHIFFAAHIIPIPGDNYKKFWQISKLIVKSLIEQDILALALCRIRVFSDEIPSKVINEIGDNLLTTIGNESWLQDKKVNTSKLNHIVLSKLIKSGINEEVAKNLSYFGFDNSLLQKNYFFQLSDSFWRTKGNSFLYSDLIKLFEVAGFSKGLILFDELEKVIAYQNTLERRNFTENVRYFFIDGESENTKTAFFELLLTIHPYLQELLISHWNSAGLDRFASLSGTLTSDYTIYFQPLDNESAISLAEAYIKASSIKEDADRLHPFDKDALTEALVKSGGVPGKFLNYLNKAIEVAIEKKWDKISIERIKEISFPIPEEPDIDDSEAVLPRANIDLKRE